MLTVQRPPRGGGSYLQGAGSREFTHAQTGTRTHRKHRKHKKPQRVVVVVVPMLLCATDVS